LTQGSEPADSEQLGNEQLGSEPTESVFGPHSYTLPPDLEFLPPPDDSPPPAFTREQVIAKTQAGIGDSGELASVDLVTVDADHEPPITGRQWLVVVTDALVRPLGGQPPIHGSPCDAPPDEQPDRCQRGPFVMTLFVLHDADTGDLTMGGNFPPQRAPSPQAGTAAMARKSITPPPLPSEPTSRGC
jgi:hypothetical protein